MLAVEHKPNRIELSPAPERHTGQQRILAELGITTLQGKCPSARFVADGIQAALWSFAWLSGAFGLRDAVAACRRGLGPGNCWCGNNWNDLGSAAGFSLRTGQPIISSPP